MLEELTVLEENNSWSIAPIPKEKHAICSRWVFKTKFYLDGSVEHHKACLVAQGFTKNLVLSIRRPLLLSPR